MRKITFCKFSLLIVFILSMGGLKAQKNYLDETFSSSSLPIGWSEEKDVLSSAMWSYTDGVAAFYGGNKLEASAAFITNAIDLSQSIMPTLSFNYLNQHARGVVDSLVVYYCSAENSDWTKLFVGADIQSKPTNVSIELTEKQQVEGFQLRFEAWNRYGSAVTIDNVKIVNASACKSLLPTEFRVVALSGDSVSFMWNPGVYADSSHVIVTTEAITDFTDYNSNIVVSDKWQANSPIINITKTGGLDSDNKYYAYLQVSCGAGDISKFVSLEFQTPCLPIKLEDKQYSQSFENNIDCWLLVSSATTYPTIVSNHASEGDKSLYFLTEEDKYSYAILPIDTTLVDMQLSFKVYSNEESNAKLGAVLNVGVLDDPGNMNSIENIRTITSNKAKVWQDILVTFTDYAGNGKYIVLYSGDAEKDNKIWVDEFVLDTLKTCYPPQSPKVDAVYPYSADLSWVTVGTSATSWYIKVSTKTMLSDELSDLDEASLTKVTSLPYTVNNLEPDTKYYVYVRSDCGEWCTESIKFKTAKVLNIGDEEEFNISDISQYSYYYANYRKSANGDLVEYPYHTLFGYPKIYDKNYDNKDGNSLYYTISPSESNLPFVIFPELHKDIDVNNIQISFYSYINIINKPFVVSVCEGSDISTAVVIDTILLTETKSWIKHIVALDNYVGNGRNIAIYPAFNSPIDNPVDLYIDNFKVENLSRCNPLMNVEISDILPTGATISWVSPAASTSATYIIDLYSESLENDPEASPVKTFNASTTEFDMTDLDMQTNYFAYVKISSTDCPDAQYSAPVKFTTGTIIDIPYFNNFSDKDGFNGLVGWSCYDPTSVTSVSKMAPQISIAEWSGNNFSFINTPSLVVASANDYLYSSTIAPETYAVMPILDESVNVSHLTIQFYAYSIGADDEHNLVVGIMDDPNDPKTFTVIDSITLADFNTVYLHQTKTNNYKGSGRYIAFKSYSETNDETNFYIDNLYIYESTDCELVSNIKVATTSISSIQASWIKGGKETSWDIKIMDVSVDGTAIDTLDAEHIIASIDAKTNPITISDLDIRYNSDYYIAVRSKTNDCVGSWVVSSFNTGCDYTVLDLPYDEDFSGYGTGDLSSPDCWYLKPNTEPADARLYSRNYENTAGASLGLKGTTVGYSYAVLPRINNVKGTTLKCQIYSADANSYVEVGVINGLDDSFKNQSDYYAATIANDNLFTPITTYYLGAANTWEEVVLDFATYNGTGDRIAFRIGKHTYSLDAKGVFIDNVSLSLTSSCSKIRTVKVGAVDNSSASISWGVLNESQWNIKVSSSVIDPEIDDADILDTDITTMPYTIENLEANTKYNVYIRRVITGDEACQGPWSDGVVITTTCEQINIGTIFDFETNENSGDVDNDCWQLMGTSDVLPYKQNHTMFETGKDATVNDSTCFAFENSTVTIDDVVTQKNTYAVLPELLVNSINDVQLTFRAFTKSNTTGQFEIAVVTNPSTYDNLNNTYEKVYSDKIPNGEWTDYRINFTNYTSDVFGDEGKFIVIQALPGVNDNGELIANKFFIDDVVITSYNADGCEIPLRFKADSVGETSARFSWMSNTVDEYQIIVVNEPTADENLAIVDTIVTSNPATIDGLPVNTKLYAFIRSKCTTGNYTDWSVPFKFHTYGCELTSLPFSEDFEYEDTYVDCLNNCWVFYKTIDTNDIYEMNNKYAASGKYALDLPTGFLAVLPMTDIEDLIMRFDMLTLGTDKGAQVGVLRAENDTVVFIPLQDIIASKTSTPELFEVRYCDYDDLLPTDQIAILSTTSWFKGNIYLDNVRVDKAYALWTATDVKTPYVSDVEADFEWTLASSNIDYVEVAVYSNDQTIEDANIYTITSAPFNKLSVSDLESSTTYNVQVRVFLNGEYSEWSVAKEFITSQVPAYIPYTTNWENEDMNSDWTLTSFASTNESTGLSYWTVGDATTHEGTNSLYITSDGDSYSFIDERSSAWAYRTIKITEPGLYSVSAVAKCPTTSSWDYMSIGFVSNDYSIFNKSGQVVNPNNSKDYCSFYLSSGDHIVKGALNRSSEWIEYTRQFAISKPGLYNVVIYNYIDGYDECVNGAGAVDEISVTKSIYAPSDLTVSNITANAAELSWVVDVEMDSFVVTLESATATKTYKVPGSSPALSLSELEAFTGYTVSVVAYDNGIYSPAATAQFTTMPIPVSTYPYINKFDNETENNAWLTIDGDNGNYWVIGDETQYGSEDQNSLYIASDDYYEYYSKCDTWICREFEFDAPGLYKISMMAQCPSDEEYVDFLSVSFVPSSFEINLDDKIYTDPVFGTTYDLGNTSYEDNPYLIINKLYGTDEDGWAEYSRVVTIPEAGVYKLAALFYTYDDWNWGSPGAIDNITIESAACMNPVSFNLNKVDDISATISWIAGSEVDNYSVFLSTDAVDNVTGVSDFTTTPIVNTTVSDAKIELSSLTAATNYYLYVKSNCGDITNYERYQFTTSNTPVAIPYSEPFESTSEDAIPANWRVVNGGSFVSTSVIDPAISETDKTLYMAENTLLVLPNLNFSTIELSALNISLDAVSSTDNAQISIGVMSVPTDITSFETLATFNVGRYFNKTEAVSDYFSYSFASYSGDSRYIAIRTSKSVYIDDILIDIPTSCATPIDFKATKIGDYSVTVEWNNSTADVTRVVVAESNAYDISYVNENDVVLDTCLTEGEQMLSFDTDPSTTYYVYANSICNNDTTKSVKLNITTAKVGMMLPYFNPIEVEDISDLEAEGWVNLGGDYYFEEYLEEADMMLEMYQNPYLQLPEVNAKYDLKDLTLDFQAIAYEDYDYTTMVIGAIEKAGDVNSFVGIDTVNVYSSQVSNLSVSLENYAGLSNRLCLYTPGDLYINNVHLYKVNTCSAPNNITIDDVTDESAKLSFTPLHESQSQWRVVVTNKPCSITELDAITSTSATTMFVQDVTVTSGIEITGLVPLTTYYVYVKSTCSDKPEWSSVNKFQSAYGRLILPYYQPIAVDYLGKLFEQGFDVLVGYSDINDYKLDNDTILALNQNAYLEFPEISEQYDMTTLGIDFNAMNFSSDAEAMVQVGILESSGDIDTFVPVDTIYTPAVTDPLEMQKYHVSFKNYTGSSRIICIHMMKNNDVYFDDFYIYEVTPCMAPVDLNISNNISGTTAELSFEPRINQDMWRVVVSEKEWSETKLNEMEAEDFVFMQDVAEYTNVELTGLDRLTQYYVYVRGVGNCDDTPVWSECATFKTPYGTITMPYFEDFSTIQNNKLPNGWLRSNSNIEDDNIEFMDTLSLAYSSFAVKSISDNENSPILATSMNADFIDAVYRWAIGPKIVIDGDGYLSFDLTILPGVGYVAADGSSSSVRQSELRLCVSSDFGATWNEEISVGYKADNDYNFNDYFESTGRIMIDMSSYIGDTIRFAFYINNIDAVNLDVNIDNISVNCVGEREYDDVISEGFDYMENGFDIFYTELIAGTTKSFTTFVPAAEAGICDSILTVNLTVLENIVTNITGKLCAEGDVYDANGFTESEPGLYLNRDISVLGADSLTYLTLTIDSVDTIYVEKTIKLSDLPYTYRDTVFDETTVVGEYTYEFEVDGDTDCPDIEVYTLNVIEGEVAVDDTRILDLSMYPNPLTSGATLYVDAEFTASELDGMVIEVMNTVGQLIINARPTTDEITINGLSESGVYIVRITTGTGIQYLGKVIVK